MISYFLRRKGLWSNRFLSKSLFFNYFLKPLVSIDVKILERSQYWPEEKIKAIQWSRIKNILDIAYRNVPFWKEHLDKSAIKPEDIKTWSDFEKIPIVKKDDLKSKPGEYVTNSNISPKWVYRDSTSGSTGVPFNFAVDRGFVLRGLAFCQRMFRSLGQRKRDTFVRFSPSDRPGLNFGNYFFPVPDYSDFENKVSDFISQYDGRTLVIYGVASYLFQLAKILSNMPHQLNFRAAIASGEHLSDVQKEFIEEKLKCPVSRCYTTREQGWIAHECLQGGFHVNSEWCYVEVVDGQGKNMPRGEQGRIIVTTFDNEVMPFIRYDTGDLGKILQEACPCGRTLPLIKFMGREAGLIRLPGGRTIHHFDLLGCFYVRAGVVKKFQIIQEAIDKVAVKIIPENDFPPFQLLTLKQDLMSILGKDVELSIELVKDIPSGPRGKSATFVSKLVQH